ncbi:hypothetical protein CFK62_09540, partial [Streptococcus agalactiae]
LVVSVYKTDAPNFTMMGTSSGGSVMANTQVASEFHVNDVGSMFIHVNDIKESIKLGEQAAEMLTNQTNVKGGKYAIPDNSAVIKEVEQQFGIMTGVIGSIAGISLLVGGIGVMNIMLVSV